MTVNIWHLGTVAAGEVAMLGQCCDRLAMTIHLWQYLTALHWQCWLRFLLHLPCPK